MTNAFIFHGTEGYPEENWFPWLRVELERRGCKTIVPQYPTPRNQNLPGWFEVFERYADKYGEQSILIGHSLGGVFALRVLERYPVKAKACFLISTPMGIMPIKNYAGDKLFLNPPFDWQKLKERCNQFTVFHSDDDPLVGMENGVQLAKNLGAEFVCIPKAGHFNAKAGYTKFPELLERIRV